MAMLFRTLARHVARKIASDPVAREQAKKVATGVAKEATRIAQKPDKAYQAGRAVRRALNKLNEG